MRPYLPLIAAAVLSACQQQAAEPRVDEAWVRLPAVSGNPGAAYFTVHGGTQARTLVAVRAPFAVRAEMHESMNHGGMMSMAPIENVAVPANATLAFAPGGKHVMLYDIAPNVRAGATVPLRLEFSEGAPIEIQARVVAAGDAAPQF